MARRFDSLLKFVTVTAVVLCGLLSANPAEAATIYVDLANCPGPGDGSPGNPFCQIQTAINAAVNGDTILVADGVYTGTGNKNLDFGGRLITLQSASGNPATCIIDCEGSGRGFYFHSSETAAAVVGGFTIRNGSVGSSSPGGANGGGVYCSYSGPTLTGCIISGSAASAGAGVACSSFSPTLLNCVISGNRVSGTSGSGGGIYCYNSSSPTLTGCVISGNAAPAGAGITCSSSSPVLTNCVISENTAAGSSASGGGLYCYSSSSPTLTSCTISGNTVVGTAPCLGGGIYCSSSNPTLINCSIRANAAYTSGGGIYCSSSSPTLTNCTIAGNSAGTSGGAVHCSVYSSHPRLTNCILWGDTPQEIYVSSGVPAVTYCDVQGGFTGTGNINAEPDFAFADDFHLMPGSPGIDTGTNAPTGGLPATDAEGLPRLVDGNGDGQAIADMGVYEFNPAMPAIAASPSRFVFFVLQGQAGQDQQTLSIRNSGGGVLAWALSWGAAWLQVVPAQGESTGEADTASLTADATALTHGTYSTTLSIIDPQASNTPREVEVVLNVTTALLVPSDYSTIQAAIDAALPGDEVIVADGMYTGAGNKDLDFRGKAIVLQSAGGNPANCIIDCEGSGRGFYFHSGEPSATGVAGIMVRNGNTTLGGGVYCYGNSRPTLTNCIIRANTAVAPTLANGGGLNCRFSSPTLIGCTIVDNLVSATTDSGSSSGGGIYCDGSNPILVDCVISGNHGAGVYCLGSNPMLTNCTIDGNAATGGAGLSCNSSSKPTLTNCTVSRNTAFGEGGGIRCDGGSASLINCRISGNKASSYGGGMSLSGSSPTLQNCTINGNTTYVFGGALYCSDGSSPTLTNCTMKENGAFSGGTLYCTYSGSSPRLTNCILWGGAPQEIYVASGSPVVTYCDVQGGYTGAGNINANPDFAFSDDVHLMPGSPCIDAGTDSPVGGLPPTDAEGIPRSLDGNGDGLAKADMGAHEFNPAAPVIAVDTTRMEFFILEGQADPTTRSLTIRNTGGGTLNWAISGEASWLQAEPLQGSSTGEVDPVTLTANVGTLPHGTYSAALQVADPAAANNPRIVELTLNVTNTFSVPGEYPTIQVAIDATSIPGDQVVVANGVYTGVGNRDLDFHGKAIVVRSAGGDPVASIIDCQGGGRGFYFHSYETAASTVEGLTVRNGHMATSEGGGVYCFNAGPTLANCAISGNAASRGGGVSGNHSFPVLTGCRIIGNTAGSGGGVYCNEFSGFTLINCIIYGNTASSTGGGVQSAHFAGLVMTNCTLRGNRTSSGGGLYIGGLTARVTNCILWADTPQEVYVSSGSHVVTYSDVQGGYTGSGNINADPGFAFADDFHLMPGSPCIDAGTNSPAGGLPATDAEGVTRPLDGNGDGLDRADIGAYESDPAAGRIAVDTTRVAFFVPEGQIDPPAKTLSIRNAGGGTLNWALSCEAAWSQMDPVQGLSTGEVDPVALTVNVSGLAYGSYFATLTVADPAAANNPRIVEVTLNVIRMFPVPESYSTIQAAIDATSVPGDQVVIADGVYTGTGNKDLDFHGKPILVRSASGDPATCIIDCQGSGRGFYFHTGETAESAVQGLTTRNGYVTGTSPGGELGGGVLCAASCSPTFIDCTISGNTASYYAYTRGGGMSFGPYSSSALTGCRISGNTATGGYCLGGGLYCEGGILTLTGCTLSGNTLTGTQDASGGGAYGYSGTNLTLNNCLISDNTTTAPRYSSGGGIYCYTSVLRLNNCTIARNRASGPSSFGGGIFSGNSRLETAGSILWGDLPQEILLDTGTATVSHSDVDGGYTGIGNINLDPLFVDPDGPDNDPSTWQDNDYRLAAGSPCIDAGNNGAVPACVTTDLDGLPRFVDDPDSPDCRYVPGTCGTPPIVDMGCYEYQALPLLLGDLNCDGLVNTDDIPALVLALIDPAAYQTAYPDCDADRADMNGDGTTDGVDIQAFVTTLIGP